MDLPLSFRLAFCGASFLWAAYYFHRASRQSRYVFLALAVLVVYGFAIEYLDIRTAHTYVYSRMLVMLGAWPHWVPLSVCITWASTFYVVSSLSDRLGLPWYQRPLMDGLTATMIDLVGDPVFSNTRRVVSFVDSCGLADSPVFGGIGVWTWCIPEQDGVLWISVPFGNFFGWFVVIAGFSLLFRVAQHKLRAADRPWPAQLGILVGCAVLATIGVELVLRVFAAIPFRYSGVVLATTLLIPLGLIVAQRQRLNFQNPMDWGLALMPIVGISSGLFLFFQRGIFRAAGPTWSAALVVVAVAGVAVALLPFAGTLLHRRPPA